MTFQIWIRKIWVTLIVLTGLVVYTIVWEQDSRAFSRASAIVEVGHNFEEKGSLQEALEQYEEAVEIYPKSAYFLALLGRAYHQAGNNEKALQTYETALKRSPRHFWVHYLIGQLYRDQQRYNDAIEKFNQLISMKDNWYRSNKVFNYTQYQNLAYGELGYCYAKIGQRQEALKAYQQYLTLNPLAQDKNSVEDYIQRLKSGS